MPAHAITLHLPETLYERFRQRATWSRRSVETELLDAVASAAPTEGELSTALIGVMDSLGGMSDSELWRMAREAMSPKASEALEALHQKQRDEGLSPAEDAARAELIHEYERFMLVRAQAAKLLKDRGHDIAKLLVRR